jgi:predicted MFS family arabinose efflux permease
VCTVQQLDDHYFICNRRKGVGKDATNTMTGNKWVIPFIATIFGMMTLQMSSLGFSPLLPAIQKEFGMNYSQIGLFTGMYGLLAIALSIPAGLLAKRFGERLVLSGGLLIVALGLFLLSVAPSFLAAFGGRGVWIIGYRFAFICVLTAIALTCPPSLKGSAMGIMGAMSSLAAVLGAPFGSAIAGDVGWRNGMLAFSGMAVLGAIVFGSFYRRDPNAAIPVTGHHLGSTHSAIPGIPKPKSAFRTPVVWALAALLGMCGMGQFSATFFVPLAAKAVFNLDAMGAATIISTGYFAAIFANLFFGYLMDRYNQWKVMGTLISLLIVVSFTMTTQNLLLFRIAAALLLALGFAATNQVYGIAGQVLRGRETGPVMGIVGLGAGIFGYVGPQMLGALRDWTGGFSAGWYMVAGVATITLIEILLLKRNSQPSRREASAGH